MADATNSGEKTIIITSGTIIKAIVIGFCFYLLYLLKDLLLVVLTAVMIASALDPLIVGFMRAKFPRLVGVLVVYIGIALIIVGAVYFFLPTFISDITLLSTTLPNYIRSADLWNPLNSGVANIGGSGISLPTFSFSDLASSVSGSFTTGGIFTTISGFFGGVLSFIIIIVLSFYLSVQEDGIGEFLGVVVPAGYEQYVSSLWKRSQVKIGLWLQGQVLLGVLVGLLIYLGLSILGVKNALFLALIVAVFEIIPVFGIVLATLPAIAVALTDGGITLALLVIGLYTIVQQFEANLIYPLVVKKIVGLPSILVILALLAGSKLAGFLGILLSIPASAIITELLADLEKQKHHVTPAEKVS